MDKPSTESSSESGWNDLVATARGLQSSDLPGRGDELEHVAIDELRAYAESNQQVLERAHQLLQRPCRVVVEFEPGFYERHVAEFTPLRELGRAFVAEAWLAWREQRPQDAVRLALDAVRLGVAVRNGGLITDLLVGMALTGIGVSFLRQRRRLLAADLALAASRDLSEIEASQEAFAAIDERDARWEASVGDAQPAEFPAPPPDGSFDEDTSRAMLTALQEYAAQPREIHRRDQLQLEQRQAATLRLLATELAMLAYRERHGTYPEQLDQLVPDWFAAALEDPFSGRPFVYRREADRYLLYSVGPDGKDDGGRFGSWPDISLSGGDLCLDHDDFLYRCLCSAKPSWGQRLRCSIASALQALRRLLSGRRVNH